MRFYLQACLLTTLLGLYLCISEDSTNQDEKLPTIGVSVLIRNKAHSLPYFFTYLVNLSYPKDRMYIWIHSDFNEDNSIEIIEAWAEEYKSQYNGMYITTNNSSGPLHSGEQHYVKWIPEHFNHVIKLRQQALDFARKQWADYLFMVDADVFLTNPDTLELLLGKKLTVVAPMLLSDGLYSNFWCGMTENYYYLRTDEYKPIREREKTGCFAVPMVHTAVLINLKRTVTDKLTYTHTNLQSYDGPVDDIIIFALSAKWNGVELYVCNDYVYGYVQVPMEENDGIQSDVEQLVNVKLEAISKGTPLFWDPFFSKFVDYPPPSKYGLDEIYMINLARRTTRRELMEQSFKELAMDVKLVEGVDGRTLDFTNLGALGVTLMPNYEDPYHKRPMKTGEIGCFLSHYYIWQEVVEKGYQRVLVLEDDIHFTPYFRIKILLLLSELEDLDWELVYIGRKIMTDDEEMVSRYTSRPGYTYWTLGYILNQSGAQKLINAKPLEKMLPVDEFLPIMFNEHPNDTWKSYFPNRDLKALSAAPLLVHPTHYTGQEGYVSDTEDSIVLDGSAFVDGRIVIDHATSRIIGRINSEL
ncbi:glycosyltransferase 25 family member [Pectinophora gossypiella]|uniref:glycosyltransferase 25 family member n=1 Tax=Pectinophora gossypiella TaxID=13191 RepID=UPI00214E52C4|nr:glycosyltransferase 25 family member [Pectinophora gossypiella]